MGDIVQAASSILTRANRAAETAAQNITNSSTPGYWAKSSFDEVFAQRSGAGLGESQPQTIFNMAEGRLIETGNALDVAILGDGLLELMGDAGPVYTRNGHLDRDADGRLVGVGGLPVQSIDGGDILVPNTGLVITADGTILDADGAPVARLAVMLADGAPTLEDGGVFSFAPENLSPVTDPRIRQGFVESSNVSLGDEMVVLMESIRRAETGQRLMNVYDDLLGRVVTTLGQAS